VPVGVGDAKHCEPQQLEQQKSENYAAEDAHLRFLQPALTKTRAGAKAPISLRSVRHE
jgi:hypothetical protein